MHEPILGNIIQHCSSIESGSQPGTAVHSVAKTLREHVIYYRPKNVLECPMYEIVYQCAALLSPVYKEMQHTTSLPEYTYGKIEALQIVARAIQAICPQLLVQHHENSRVQEPLTKRRKMHPVLNSGHQRDPPPIQTNRDTLGEIVRREYISFSLIPPVPVDDDRACPLAFWRDEATSNRHRLLSIIARFVYTPPVTSVPSERLFSRAGLVRQKTRAALTPSTTEMILKVGPYLRVQLEMS